MLNKGNESGEGREGKEGKEGKENIWAKRRLGQNFLVDRGVLGAIVERAGVSRDDVILEVGPGNGVLTRALLGAGCGHLHAVEADLRLAELLAVMEADFAPRLSVVLGDAMKVPLDLLSPFPNKLVSNIPYNITPPLLWRLLPLAARGLTYMLCMVQKEAAERLTAASDTKARYPLGVTFEAMGGVAVVRSVPPECFRPVPRVESAIVEIRVERRVDLADDALWRGLLRQAFRQRRKTLANNLRGFRGVGDWPAVLEGAGVDPRIRAEDLTCEEWLAVHAALRGGADI
jgi:16S rRNA (adenine1518-N6/adenine1519-N6)-dimethyltransferase